MYNLISGLYKLGNTMTHLSADVVHEIAPYLDMPTLRKMIGLSEDMEPSIGEILLLEFYRRGEKFVNWVNSLAIVREVTDEKIIETTYISESMRIMQSSSLASDDYSLSRIIMIDGVEMKSTRWWNGEGMMISSAYYKNGHLHDLFENWNNQGLKTSSVNFNDGEFHGLLENWNNQGLKTRSCNYKNGELHGPSEYWNDLGRKVFSVNYENGNPISE